MADGASYVPISNIRQYFGNAFGGAGLADAIAARYGPGSSFAESSESNRESAGRQYGGGDTWRFVIGDPGSAADMEVPREPLRVVDGKVTLRDEMGGAWGDWSGENNVWWDITLDVVKSGSSPYGCNDIGYSVTAEDADPAVAAPSVLTMTPPPAQTPAEAPTPRAFDDNGFVFADSSECYLTDTDLQGLSKEMLAFARNEIFARNGNLFRKDKYIDHYTQYEWYNSIPNKRHDIYEWELNPTEQANIKLIQQYEAA